MHWAQLPQTPARTSLLSPESNTLSPSNGFCRGFLSQQREETKTEPKEHSLRNLSHWTTGEGPTHQLRVLSPPPQPIPHCFDGLLKSIPDVGWRGKGALNIHTQSAEGCMLALGVLSD